LGSVPASEITSRTALLTFVSATRPNLSWAIGLFRAITRPRSIRLRDRMRMPIHLQK
jgi:hypothetical protein